MDDFWKPLALIIGASVLIALGIIFFGVGSSDVDGLARLHIPVCAPDAKPGPTIGDAIKISGC